MRKCTKNYIEGILKLYPDYVEAIRSREESILNPDELYIDQNIGGGRSSIVGRPTEQKVMAIIEDDELDAIKYHKVAIERTLKGSDFITTGIIEAFYFAGTGIDIIADDLGTTPKICSGLKSRYLDKLATELRLIK